jgi:hypothetical protein
MILEIYKAIKQRVEQSVTELNTIEWYFEQYGNDAGENLVWSTPAAYVEFEEIPWVTLPKKVQRGEVTMRVHTVSACAYGENDKRVTQNLDGISMTHLAVVQAIYVALQGYSCAYNALPEFSNSDILFNEIVRKNTITDHRLGEFMVTITEFTFVAFDCLASPVLQRIEPATLAPEMDIHYPQ